MRIDQTFSFKGQQRSFVSIVTLPWWTVSKCCSLRLPTVPRVSFEISEDDIGNRTGWLRLFRCDSVVDQLPCSQQVLVKLADSWTCTFRQTGGKRLPSGFAGFLKFGSNLAILLFCFESNLPVAATDQIARQSVIVAL